MRLPFYVAINDWREPWQKYIEDSVTEPTSGLFTDEDRFELRQMHILLPGSEEVLQSAATHSGEGRCALPQSDAAESIVPSAKAIPTTSAARSVSARRTHARPTKPLTYDELPHVPNLPPQLGAGAVTSADVTPVSTPRCSNTPMQCSRDWNGSVAASSHPMQNRMAMSNPSATIEQLLTPQDCCELREMHILPPGCPEENHYILQHPCPSPLSEVSHERQH